VIIDISDKLYEYLVEMEKDELLEVMFAALDNMQSYNGQSQTSAIMRGMRAEELTRDDGTVYWKLNRK
jgi:hypothetical protein